MYPLNCAALFNRTGGGCAAKTPMGLAGRLRPAGPHGGKDGLSACPMESEAAYPPPYRLSSHPPARLA
ncbi:hypothetical protein RRU94_10425 [Domibacillus sp. DTU_2020_1001157_1_SI_ALB_TIR_016]|uniref:hypothetical protein n=1 Tax=Domibacillus sp. DTU_2020_1001157_1_SI_ALB_TIR_016 TaxID=3077789 RepID=UPI0028EC858A|nr:hypothetical protein [Domibacillus sp. DTU_2020_1001157_1_SI_ALB_TIR_016]WNS81217.1 hypothetical protein RRU94_10425 [Domibacillus sp. DTU_2020_1001157_1_SI_ALB_TIR_016]